MDWQFLLSMDKSSNFTGALDLLILSGAGGESIDLKRTRDVVFLSLPFTSKTFNQVEIHPEMTGHYLGEFSITYKPVRHGRPGIGSTNSSRFIPLS